MESGQRDVADAERQIYAARKWNLLEWPAGQGRGPTLGDKSLHERHPRAKFSFG